MNKNRRLEIVRLKEKNVVTTNSIHVVDMFQAKINRLKRIRLVRSRLGYRHKHIPISLPSSNCSTDKLKPICKSKKSQRSIEKHGTIQLVNTPKCIVNHITLCSRVGDDGELRTMSIKYHFSDTVQRSITARFSVNDGQIDFSPIPALQVLLEVISIAHTQQF